MNILNFVFTKFCTNNKNKIEKSIHCYCYHCKSKIQSSEITEYVKEKYDTDSCSETAICPICGIDSVIPDTCFYDSKFREVLIDDMNEKFFNT